MQNHVVRKRCLLRRALDLIIIWAQLNQDLVRSTQFCISVGQLPRDLKILIYWKKAVIESGLTFFFVLNFFSDRVTCTARRKRVAVYLFFVLIIHTGKQEHLNISTKKSAKDILNCVIIVWVTREEVPHVMFNT